ncbi:flavodoxin-dependent (E)-4-hydroxy-3-methylbut-2-enyl-diphosphate synthase [Dehalogenimonas etheniformans]|uniref:4-hydroxy-3-methylbut-2-en-1-yl diphosphate synthase (flavodoxin) n=1 Tax=Dehalogenimonas etheniformans TaxID=1536648 RepID=A0A2P5P7E3_9CHLR|nr:flavodoxin-dependent (E)-4-hydroxy-3-methylbut-2-enyl-diphosphate synthase [Dehalogenimonas etheniformans]PPD58212.1 flavodoxin-dependent (E)-4-hydroxy-3-methylbut-2-enyl-diphosphate synthase [Dehalogenimonas etheniformans]QNT75621.1 flavodoxin-dependent (E)-4-hydroxy-3-methylbut-2-enyl-diphosphate synthase [Dehalogenimonas etheniformans]
MTKSQTQNQRRKTKAINIGGVMVGGDAPISVQSMTKTDTRDVSPTVAQITDLAEAGCEIIRCGVPDAQAAEALREIKKRSPIPVIADIHFDYRLALTAIAAGVDGLRINPGNIGGEERVKQVVEAAKGRKVPIRIGVNGGSLPEDFEPDKPLHQRMVDSAMGQVRLLESLDFDLIKISLKAFDVPETLTAYRMISGMVDYPLHLGMTEAGTPRTGIIRSAVGIGALLSEGIGDTIRVSLTAHPREEIVAGYEILKSLDLRQKGPTLVSCPSCSRTEADVVNLAEKIADALLSIDKPVKVAVMGCAVNGPGEAKDADVGIACGKGQGILFRRGEKIRVVAEADFFDALLKEIENF